MQNKIPPENMLNLLIKMHVDLQPLTEKIKYDKHNMQHLTIMALYGSIFEFIGSCLLLIQHRQLIGVPILIRSLLEAYVDISNTITHQDYVNFLAVDHLEYWIKFFKESMDNDEEQSLAFNNRREELREQGYKKINIEAKFAKASMSDEYDITYNMLCCDSHNNLIALLRRHLKQQPETFNLAIYKKHTLDHFSMCLALLLEYFILASEKVHAFFGGSVQTEVGIYRSILNNEAYA